MTLTLHDPTALKILIDARLESLRVARPNRSAHRLARRN